MRAWLFVFALAACRYNTPEPGATTGDATGDGAPVDEAVIDPIDAPPGAWMHPYLHRKRITLIASKIDDTGGALTDFPVLISLDDGDLAAATNLPDMAFTAGDATTQLDSEIESYASGKLVAWVRIPNLSATQNTQIFLYYGNPSPPPTSPEGVWGDFLGVWHLSQDPGSGAAGEIRDATAGNRDGQTSGMGSQDLDPAQVGNGFSFDGSNDFVDFPTIDLGNAFTISAWANLDPGASGVKTIISNSAQGANTNGVRFFLNTSGQANRRVVLETGNGSTSSACRTADNAITAGSWAQVVAVVDRTNAACKVFVNGVDVTVSGNARNDFTNSSDFEIGRMEGSLVFFGMLDEINIASTLRPAGWILTTYNNQLSPSTFYMVSDAENEP